MIYNSDKSARNKEYGLRILVVGEFPPPEGGVSISLQHLYDELSGIDGIHLTKIDITQSRKRRRPLLRQSRIVNNLISFSKYLVELPKKAWNCDVISLHIVSSKLAVYGAYALLVCRILRKRVIIRKFGGTEIDAFSSLPRALMKMVLSKCDAYLAQTKYLVEEAKRHGISQVYWFPTHRPPPQGRCAKPSSRYCSFAYVGQVRREKGLYVLMEALGSIPKRNPIMVTVYGPITEPNAKLSAETINQTPHMQYGGVLAAGEVSDTLAKHHAFVFPTFWPGEGYPGALIEALTVGLPAIVSDWRAVPEVVNRDCAITVSANNVEELREAILRMAENRELWSSMHHAALERGRYFSVNKWAREFIEICRRL